MVHRWLGASFWSMRGIKGDVDDDDDDVCGGAESAAVVDDDEDVESRGDVLYELERSGVTRVRSVDGDRFCCWCCRSPVVFESFGIR